MTRTLSKLTMLMAGAAVLAAASLPAMADDLTVVSFGGAYGAAQKKSMIDPYVAAKGTNILFEDYSGGVAEMTAQVESNNVLWDVVDIEAVDLERACSEGLLEVIPRDILPPGDDGTPAAEDFFPAALANECGVGIMFWSMIYAYNTETIKGGTPTTVADFFDTEKFPGKRALWNYSQGGGYEAALLADGVPEDQLYPIDYDRAFKKLDTIKDDLVVWESGAQSQEMAESGEVDMMLIWNGRLYNAVQNGSSFTPQWNQNMSVYDVFMVPKGTENKDAAMAFIAYATGKQAQEKLTETIPYSPIHADAKPKVDKQLERFLTTQPEVQEKAILVDQQWWADNYDEATQRWTAWQAG
jgi:putative spermidine/putrescine transport system substrate-binding protein